MLGLWHFIPTCLNSNRAALVTGGARRIGREIALALARDGWDVAVHYATSRDDALDTVAQIEAIGRRAIAVNRDLAVEPGVLSLLAECANELAPVTCVVNNASLFEYDNVARFTPDHLLRAMRTNAAAPVMLARSLHEHLAHDAHGVVINLLDQKLENPNPDFLSYTLSKAALKEATRLLAIALAPKVRVVGIAPGITLASNLQSDMGFAERIVGPARPIEHAARCGASGCLSCKRRGGDRDHLAGRWRPAPGAEPRDVMFATEPQLDQDGGKQ